MKNFTSSSDCPDGQTCFWTLHENNFYKSSNPFKFFFLPFQIGERTLSYVLMGDSDYQNLSSCTTNVKPDHRSGSFFYIVFIRSQEFYREIVLIKSTIL